MELREFIIFRRADGKFKVCGLSEAEHDIELSKGSVYIGTFQTTLNILQVQELFNKRV